MKTPLCIASSVESHSLAAAIAGPSHIVWYTKEVYNMGRSQRGRVGMARNNIPPQQQLSCDDSRPNPNLTF